MTLIWETLDEKSGCAISFLNIANVALTLLKHLPCCTILVLFDFIYDYSLKQLVDTPTRQGNILDLILTNALEHCNECTAIPGISDHEAVIARFTFCPIRHKQLARTIPLYRKADWPSFNNHMIEFHARIIGGGAPTLEVNQLWAEFKQAINNGISKYIPHKLAKSTNRKPWVSRETKE